MKPRQGAAAAAVFAVLAALPWLGKAWHIDEPLYLPAALQILKDPWHPYAFLFNWYGKELPYAAINNTPPILHYLLAGAVALTGGAESWTRLLFLPFDAAAAAGLYLLAAKRLKRPLWPVLAVLAGPCYLINMGHLMAEKLVAAFGFWAVYLALRYAEERKESLFYASAALLALALLSKYLAALFLPAILLHFLFNGLAPRKAAAYLFFACLPLLIYALWQSDALAAAALVTRQSLVLPTAGWAHKLRSLLAFTGGTVAFAGLWPFLAERKRAWLAVLVAAALFLPAFDIAPLVRSGDRLLGLALAAAGLWGLRVGAFSSPLWFGWTAGALAVTLSYWSVMARLTLFLAPPLVLGAAQALEARWSAARLARLQAAAVAATLCFTMALAAVDARHAASLREAVKTAVDLASPGGKVWSAGHWGLQWYVERAGGGVLDTGRGGWAQARPGDVVIVPRVNTNVLRPRAPVAADVFTTRVESAVPLRLLSGWTGEGGFYSNVFGFLPYSLSREPVEELEFIRIK